MFIDKNGKVRKPVAYLADFGMFLPQLEENVKEWKRICDKYGIIGLFPGDEAPDDEYKPYVQKDDSLAERAKWIFSLDYNQMKRSDMVIAQLDNWRGLAPDSGTAFETGYFLALDMPTYGYVTDWDTLFNKSKFNKTKDENGIYRGEDNLAIEQRDYPMDNIFQLVKIAPSLEETCKLARQDFDRQLIENGYEPYKIIED